MEKDQIEKIRSGIIDFVLNVRRIYPEAQTYNPLEEETPLPDTVIDHQVEDLFAQVVHCVTVINQSYRIERQDGKLESSHEDIINAMSLMDKLLNPSILLGETTRKAYKKILKKRGVGWVFIRKDLEQVIRCSRTQAARIVFDLSQTGLIKQISGNRRSGYVWQLEKAVDLPDPPKKGGLNAMKRFISMEDEPWKY